MGWNVWGFWGNGGVKLWRFFLHGVGWPALLGGGRPNGMGGHLQRLETAGPWGTLFWQLHKDGRFLSALRWGGTFGGGETGG